MVPAGSDEGWRDQGAIDERVESTSGKHESACEKIGARLQDCAASHRRAEKEFIGELDRGALRSDVLH